QGPPLWCSSTNPGEPSMTTKQQVLDALATVASPDGVPLTSADVLSDVVVTDGKVFFSIAVDAAAVARWEPARKRAEEAVRSLPGVQSALVALTAERRPGGEPPRSASVGGGAAPRAHGTPPRTAGIPGVEAVIAVA